MSEPQQTMNDDVKSPSTIDVIIVGAGFSGLYMLYRLRELGFSARILEAADDLGGTWYWNRYPGARCDIESVQYAYSFSETLRQEWHWSERYASQPEILSYLNYMAAKFDLRSGIRFRTRVTSAVYDEVAAHWTIHTDGGDQIVARFCIMATGCLSMPKKLDMKGIDRFQGDIYYTSQWPHDTVNFNDRKVAVIGTGSSAVQSIPIIAQQAAHLYVFQRTPCFSVPARNVPLAPKKEYSWKKDYDEHHRRMLKSYFGVELDNTIDDASTTSVTPEKQQEVYEARWQIGGLLFLSAFNDLLLSQEANDIASEFVRSKIRTTVKDPVVAEILSPRDYPVGSKRACIDSNYYETYNRDNVTLVDLRQEPIEEITTNGIKTRHMIYDVDTIVFATGFDAMTGALLSMDIQGRSGCILQEKWMEGPRTYLGIMTSGFPNLFMITGPGSPSVLSNMAVSIELHVEWLADCLAYLRKHQLDSIEATSEAEEAWGNHVNEVANATLFPKANSWYIVANVPGKPRVFMPYAAGVAPYRKKCNDVAANGYEGFQLRTQPTSTN